MVVSSLATRIPSCISLYGELAVTGVGGPIRPIRPPCLIAPPVKDNFWGGRLLFSPFDAGQNQNLREFLGSLLSLILMLVYQHSFGFSFTEDLFIRWTNDTIVTWAWARSEACKNFVTQSANVVFAWLQLYSKISIREAAWIPGELMGDIDSGSRDLDAPSLLPELYFDLSGYPEVFELFSLCDPSLSRQTIDHHESFLSIHLILRRFMESLSHP